MDCVDPFEVDEPFLLAGAPVDAYLHIPATLPSRAVIVVALHIEVRWRCCAEEPRLALQLTTYQSGDVFWRDPRQHHSPPVLVVVVLLHDEGLEGAQRRAGPLNVQLETETFFELGLCDPNFPVVPEKVHHANWRGLDSDRPDGSKNDPAHCGHSYCGEELVGCLSVGRALFQLIIIHLNITFVNST